MRERWKDGRCGMRADASAVAIPLSSLPDQCPSDGAVRWYAVHVPAGREASFAEKCRKALDPALLEDCIASPLRALRQAGRRLALETEPLFAEYVFVATRDAEALAKALGRLSFAAPIVGRTGARVRAALAAGVQSWLESTLDASHVLRASEGRIDQGVLTVERGPLRGSERIVRKMIVAERLAFVALGGGDEGFLLKAALSVLSKS